MAETVKHTLGPWKVRPHWSDEARFEVYPDRVVEFGAPAEIADVSGHSASDIDVEIAEAYANANLISAAPDLLEAVQETLRLFRYNTDDARPLSHHHPHPVYNRSHVRCRACNDGGWCYFLMCDIGER